MQNIEIKITEDGSLGLYDKNLDEIFHSIHGAKTEAMEKFIEPCFVIDKTKPLKILDICYGIGYNTKCALENFKNIKKIDCIEINKELVKQSADFEFSEKINEIIRNNLKKPDFINFYIDDARKIIPKLHEKYDIIFFDGFAPHKQSELWSENFISKVVNLMDKNSVLTTYNHSKPVLNALFKTEIVIGKTLKNNKTIATIASFNKNYIKNPLNEFEIGQLNTKSAITYKDRNLDKKHDEIIKTRNEEILTSKLITLSAYKKLHLIKH